MTRAGLTLKEVMSDPDFLEVPEEERRIFGIGEKRIRLKRIIYGSYLLKKELFMLRGRSHRLGEKWLIQNAPEFIDYSRYVGDKSLDARIEYLLQEVSYLRATLRLQAKIELKKLRPVNREV